MGIKVQRTLTRAFISGALVAFLGCSSAPRVCNISPIAIEEMKSDSRDLDVILAQAREKLAKAQADLAGWEERLAERQAEPPVLIAELERLKKASGRLEPQPEEETPQPGSQARQSEPETPFQRDDG
ncbi:MAG: hypothetical protein ACE5EO_09570 [Candidatus Krumholzibacteriia bacterium]